MTYNVFGGTIYLALSVYLSLLSLPSIDVVSRLESVKCSMHPRQFWDSLGLIFLTVSSLAMASDSVPRLGLGPKLYAMPWSLPHTSPSLTLVFLIYILL